MKYKTVYDVSDLAVLFFGLALGMLVATLSIQSNLQTILSYMMVFFLVVGLVIFLGLRKAIISLEKMIKRSGDLK